MSSRKSLLIILIACLFIIGLLLLKNKTNTPLENNAPESAQTTAEVVAQEAAESDEEATDESTDTQIDNEGQALETEQTTRQAPQQEQKENSSQEPEQTSQATNPQTTASSKPTESAVAEKNGAPIEKSEPITTKKSAPTTQAVRSVKIVNTINHEMLGYKHWTGKYHPTTFTMTINGKPFSFEEENEVAVEHDKLLIEYYYEFMNGYRKDRVKLEFNVPQKISQLTMSFDWKSRPHVLFDEDSVTLTQSHSQEEAKHEKGKRKSKKSKHTNDQEDAQ